MFCDQVFSPSEDLPDVEPPRAQAHLHAKYLGILKEMVQTGSQIVVFPIAYASMERIRLEHWPRGRGMTEKALRTLVDGGFVRRLQAHPMSKAFPRYLLTDHGRAVASK